MKRISVVIPVHNEEESLPELVLGLGNVRGKLKQELEVILVDDGSTDESLGIIRELKGKYDFLKGIALKKNFGQTAALSAGFDAAEGDVVITMDADLQNDPEDIPMLVEHIEKGHDVVSGWRKDRKDKFLTRRLPSKAANWLISWYTGVRLHDYGCTLKAYRKELLDTLSLYGELHRFIPALLSWSGADIIEVPVRHHPRKYGYSKYNLSRVVNVILDLLTVKFLLVSVKGPMQIFGRVGLWSVFLGVLSGAATVVMKLVKNTNMTGNPLLYLAIFLVFVGLQFLIMGLLGELNMRVYTKAQKRKIYRVDESRWTDM